MPKNADVGEHNGCIVFVNAHDEGTAEGGIRIKTRQAIRVAATIPGDLRRDISVVSLEVEQAIDTLRYHLALQNVGNVSADVDAVVHVRNIFGREVSRQGGVYPVLADQDLALVIDGQFRPIFGGWYTIRGTASYNQEAGTYGVLTSDVLTVKESESIRIFLWPTSGGLLVIGLVLVTLAGVGAWLLSRRHVRNLRAQTWSIYTVRGGDTLVQLAGKYAISWQKLARINTIKPPYVLEKGMKIQVPSEKAPRKQHKHDAKKDHEATQD